MLICYQNGHLKVSEKKAIVYFEGTYFHSQRAHHVKSTLIWRRYYIIYVEDQMSTNFHVISTYFFDVISLIKKSTLFRRTFSMYFRWSKNPLFSIRCHFDDRRIHVVSTYFCQCNFDGWKIHVFPITFFDVILVVVKSTLFARTFFNEISLDKNSASFLVKLQANENIRGDFTLLVTLKSWLL